MTRIHSLFFELYICWYYNENNKDIIAANQAQSDLTDTMSKIGEYTEPAMTKLKNAVTDMVDTALPYLKSFMEWTEEHGTGRTRNCDWDRRRNGTPVRGSGDGDRRCACAHERAECRRRRL